MNTAVVRALLFGALLVPELQAQTADVPMVTVSARAELAGDVLARVRDQTGLLVFGDPFINERRITVDIADVRLPEALDMLSIAAVSTWDCAYVLVPGNSEWGPDDQPPGWVRPPQTVLSLGGGSGSPEDITRAITNKCAAPVGYVEELASASLTTEPVEEAALEEVLGKVGGMDITWTRGFWLAPIDRAAVFGRYAALPLEEREARVLRHTDQMLRLDQDDVRQALFARHRQFSALSPEERQTQIVQYAEQIRTGISVLNTLSSAVRDRARDGMRIFFEMGLEVYRDLTEEEQIETTPIIEAMGELER